ncbi:MAG: hypothetical protein QN174_07745 [Armatimonadota bacterium]|nr:hypothetical protein [Armatimonadota bacterium]
MTHARGDIWPDLVRRDGRRLLVDGAAVATPRIYTFATPSATWVVPHGLGRAALVQVVCDGAEVVAEVEQTDADTVTVRFAAPRTGYVIVA